jgi:transposase-like protein
MNPVTKKRYTAEFKAQAVGLVGMGKPVKEVARDLGISEGVLYGWARKGAQAAQLGSAGPRADGVRS